MLAAVAAVASPIPVLAGSDNILLISGDSAAEVAGAVKPGSHPTIFLPLVSWEGSGKEHGNYYNGLNRDYYKDPFSALTFQVLRFFDHPRSFEGAGL